MTDRVERIAVNQTEAALMLGISEAMVRKLDAQGVLHGVKLGGCKRYLVDDLKALFKRKEDARVGNTELAG